MALDHHVAQMIVATIVGLAPLPLSLLMGGRGDARPRSALEGALVVLVVWCAVQMAIGMVLGMLGWLNVPSLLAVDALLLAGGGWALRRAGTWCWPLQVGRDLRLGAMDIALITVLLAMGLTMAWRLLSRPTDNFDSLYYHLPHVAWWLQHGDLRLHEAFYPVHRYPFGWEVVCTLLVLPLREDLLVSVPNLAAWTLLGTAVARVGRLLGADRRAALVAAALVLAAPEMLARLDAVQVDVALAAFFMAALALGMSWLRRPSPVSLFVFLVCLGCMVAIKLTGWVYSLLLFVVLGAQVAIASRGVSRRLADRGGQGRALVLGLLTAALLAGFWYVRNAIDLGNPFGYFEVRLAGLELFPGPLEIARLKASSLARIAGTGETFNWGFYLRLLYDHFGPGLYLLALSACLRPLVGKSLPPRARLGTLLTSVALLGGSFLAYWTSPASAGIGQRVVGLTPWTANSLRFAFPFVAALAGVAAGAWRPMPRVPTALAPLVMIWGLWNVVQLTGPRPVVAGLVAAMPVLLFVRPRRAGVGRTLGRFGAFPSLAVPALWFGVGMLVSHTARAERDARRPEVYGAGYRFLCEEVDPAETLGWISSTRSYMFYGKNLDRRVTYVGRRSDELDDWLDLLRERDVSVVALGPFTRRQEGWKGMRERRWMAVERSRFVKLAGTSFPRDVFYYRFTDQAPAATDSSRADRRRRDPR